MWNYEENYDEKPLWMATGTLPAGKKSTDPYPRGNSQTRTRTRNPRRVKNYAHTRYPRVHPRTRQNHASNNNIINSNGAKASIMQINIVKHTRTCSSVHGYITHSSTFRSTNPNMHSSASQSLRNKQDTYHI